MFLLLFVPALFSSQIRGHEDGSLETKSNYPFGHTEIHLGNFKRLYVCMYAWVYVARDRRITG